MASCFALDLTLNPPFNVFMISIIVTYLYSFHATNLSKNLAAYFELFLILQLLIPSKHGDWITDANFMFRSV